MVYYIIVKNRDLRKIFEEGFIMFVCSSIFAPP